MIKGYSEIPENWGNIAPYVNRGSLVQSIFLSKKCFFYDACSFRYHANLKEQDAEKILDAFLWNWLHRAIVWKSVMSDM